MLPSFQFTVEDTSWIEPAAAAIQNGTAVHAFHAHLQVQARYSLHYLSYIPRHGVPDGG